eukprot:gene16891-20085_t
MTTTSATGATLPTINGVTIERVDLIPLKKQLGVALKDNVDLYWDCVKRYFQGKLSKNELNFHVHAYLTESNIHLHNAFFKAVIYNSFYAKTAAPILEPPKTVAKQKIASFSLVSPPQMTPSVSAAVAGGASSKEGGKERERAKSSKESSGKEKRKDKKNGATTPATGPAAADTKAKPSSKKNKTKKTGSTSRSALTTSTGSVTTQAKRSDKRNHPKCNYISYIGAKKS